MPKRAETAYVQGTVRPAGPRGAGGRRGERKRVRTRAEAATAEDAMRADVDGLRSTHEVIWAHAVGRYDIFPRRMALTWL